MPEPETRTRTLITLTLLVCTLALFSVIPAQAVKTATEIQQVVADLATGTLTINGTGFDRQQDTSVTLGGVELEILTETSTEIVAVLPATAQPGNYLLKVFILSSDFGNDEFDVTILPPPQAAPSPGLFAVDTFNTEGGSVFAVSVTPESSGDAIPGMSVDIVVPDGEDRTALVTFSAMSRCVQSSGVLDGACIVTGSIHLGGSELFLSPVEAFAPAQATDRMGSYSHQWVIESLAPGSYKLVMRWGAFTASGNPLTFSMSERSLSVLTFPLSDADAKILPE